jgi:hypothetical protein
MTKILTAAMMALTLATASMAIPTEVFAKGGKHYSGGKHGKVTEVESNDDDDNGSVCKMVRKRSGKMVPVCKTTKVESNDDDDNGSVCKIVRKGSGKIVQVCKTTKKDDDNDND